MKRNTLAAALSEIANSESTLETRADAVIAVVAPLKTLEAFNSAVKAAYEANGWQAAPGKTEKAAATVPPTVKQYVSQIRAAFRLGLPIARFKTMGALRKAVKEARPPSPAVESADPKLAGIRLVKSGEITGAPFHDLVALYENLDTKKQAQLASMVSRLVRQFQPAAPALRLAA